MWDRTILKSNARVALTGRYGTAYAACLLVSLITGVFDIMERFRAESSGWFFGDSFFFMRGQPQRPYYLNIVLAVFFGIPLTVGLARFFVRNRFGETDLRTVFSGFRRDYGNTLGAMFGTDLLVLLWMFLLIIPGIIKSMEYSMVSYILSDNPSMPGGRARQISGRMTDGEKGAVFVLYLSFFGWYFLAAAAIAAGNRVFRPAAGLISAAVIPLVTAYQKATFAELYIFMRDRAIRSGAARPEEFGLVPPQPDAHPAA